MTKPLVACAARQWRLRASSVAVEAAPQRQSLLRRQLTASRLHRSAEAARVKNSREPPFTHEIQYGVVPRISQKPIVGLPATVTGTQVPPTPTQAAVEDGGGR